MASYFTQLSRPRSKFEENGSSFIEFIKKEHNKKNNNVKTETKIHGYQIQAVLNTKKHFDEVLYGNAPPALIVTPPGSGKTGMVVIIPYALQCRKVLIISPSTTISRQLSEAFGHVTTVPSFFETTITTLVCLEGIKNFLEPVTLINSTNQVVQERTGNLVIVNAQKFSGRSNTSLMHNDVEIVRNVKEFFDQFNTVIVDEAHHYPARTWRAIVENFEKKKMVFLTATPYHRGRPILPNQCIVFELKRSDIEGHTIRNCRFEEMQNSATLNFATDQTFCKELYKKIKHDLREHDKVEPRVKHQAIILVRLISEAKDLARNLDKLHLADHRNLVNKESGSHSFNMAWIGG